MKNKFLIIVLLSLVILYIYNGDYKFFAKDMSDVKNISYIVEGYKFDMKDGVAKVKYDTDTDSASENTLIMFGEPVYGDLDADGDEDAVAWLVNDLGGSGLFFYAVIVVNDNGDYKSTNALILGDRIAPQTLEIHNGLAVFNYAVRRDDEPMTASPSVGKSFWIKYDKSTQTISEGEAVEF